MSKVLITVMAKSLILTYVFWLVGGAVGLHHVYLGRFKQAFLYWCMPGKTPSVYPLLCCTIYFGCGFFSGGYFGAGWFRDLWRIPEYVRDANNDPDFLADLSEKVRTWSKPPFKVIFS